MRFKFNFENKWYSPKRTFCCAVSFRHILCLLRYGMLGTRRAVCRGGPPKWAGGLALSESNEWGPRRTQHKTLVLTFGLIFKNSYLTLPQMITKEIKPQSLLSKRNKVKGKMENHSRKKHQLCDCLQWLYFSNDECAFSFQQ